MCVGFPLSRIRVRAVLRSRFCSNPRKGEPWRTASCTSSREYPVAVRGVHCRGASRQRTAAGADLPRGRSVGRRLDDHGGARVAGELGEVPRRHPDAEDAGRYRRWLHGAAAGDGHRSRHRAAARHQVPGVRRPGGGRPAPSASRTSPRTSRRWPSLDGRFFDQDRFTPTEGTPPRSPPRASRIAVNQAAADNFGYRVGQVLDLGHLRPDDSPRSNDPGTPALRTPPASPRLGMFPNEVLQDDTDRSPLVLLTPAYTRRAAVRPVRVAGPDPRTRQRRRARGEAAVRVPARSPARRSSSHVTATTTFHVEQAVRPLADRTRAVRSHRRARGVGTGRAGAGPAAAQRGAGARRATRHGRHAASDGGRHRARPVPQHRSPGRWWRSCSRRSRRRSCRSAGCAGWRSVPGSTWTGPCSGSVRSRSSWCSACSSPSPSARGSGQPRTAGRLRPSRVLGAAKRTGVSPAALAGIQLAVEPGSGRSAVPVRSVMAGVAVAVIALTERGDVRQQPELARQHAAPVRVGVGRDARRRRWLRRRPRRGRAARVRPRPRTSTPLPVATSAPARSRPRTCRSSA